MNAIIPQMIRTAALATLILFSGTAVPSGASPKGQTPSPSSDFRFDRCHTEKIWDNGYCAFPSICEFKGRTFIAFREGESHVFNSRGEADGRARVIVSGNGKAWKSVALLSKEGYDLRDPKLSVTPDGRLMLLMDGSVYVNKTLTGMVPHVSFSSDGKTFSDPEPVVFGGGIQGGREWIWRLTWHEGTGYGVVYGNEFALLKTTDGIHYDMICELDVDGAPNESTVRFTPEGRMLMMVRREKGDRLGWWGYSDAPYTSWNWTQMSFRLGGPDFIIDSDRIIAGSRYMDNERPCMMILSGSLSDGLAGSPSGELSGGPSNATPGRLSTSTSDSPSDETLKTSSSGKEFNADFRERMILPSGRDCSYPGLLKNGYELWVVYYSAHETGRAAIYLSRLYPSSQSANRSRTRK